MSLINEGLVLINKLDGSENASSIVAMVFIFGHFSIMLIAALLCFPAKYLHKTIYNFFGILSAGSFLALFANLLFLLPASLFGFPFKLSFGLGILISFASYLIILYKFGTLNKLGEIIEKTSFENRSDEFYQQFYVEHYQQFFQNFFKEPPPKFVKRLHQGFKQAYKLDRKNSFSEEFIAEFISDFSQDFPIDTPVEHIETILHDFFNKHYANFLKRFPNEFPETT